jgi:hypothetical protein
MPVPATPALAIPAPVAAHPAGWTCGAKSTGGQMASCEEAPFYWTQCAVQRWDGDSDSDSDGVPCASLCNC